MNNVPRRIIIFSHTSELSGGAERSILDIVDYWTAEGNFTFKFIIRKPIKELSTELKKRNITYEAVYYTNWAQRRPRNNPVVLKWLAKRNLEAIKQISKIIIDFEADLVITNTSVAPWAAIASKNMDIDHAWFIREVGSFDKDFEYLMGEKKTFKDINKIPGTIVANSEYTANFIRGYTQKPIQVFYTPINRPKILDLASKEVKAPYTSKDSLKLVIVGRISESKGQYEIVRAIGTLNKSNQIKLELCIIGSATDVNDNKKLLDEILKNRLTQQVHLVEQTSNPYPYIAASDIGIMSSQNEAFGRVTLEYMMLGKPVIGVESGATPELVKDSVNGYLYKRGDVNSLVNIIKKYLSDRNLVLTQGKQSLVFSKKILRKGLMPKNLSTRHTKKREVETYIEKILVKHATFNDRFKIKQIPTYLNLILKWIYIKL